MTDGNYTSTGEWKKIRKAFLATQPQPYTCTYCDRTDLAGMSLHVDHIMPGKQKDGTWSYDNSFDNLQILCDICNGRKKDKVMTKRTRVDWMSDKWY
jgi:5-methylcytosine-specific restriction endonuclease McrA